MNRLTLETAFLLEAVFGPELKGELIPEWADRLGYHKARAAVLTNSTLRDVTPEWVRYFIRECLINGLGEWPKGWSFGPHDASSDDLALIVWTMKPEAAT